MYVKCILRGENFDYCLTCYEKQVILVYMALYRNINTVELYQVGLL